MKSKSSSIAKSTGIIILFSFIGKMMGFGRESLVASVFGAGFEKDAFVAAQSATSTVSMFIVMGISTVFIPGLQSVLSDRGEEGKMRFTNNIFYIVSLLTFLLTALGIFGAPLLAKLVGPRFDEQTARLCIQLIQLGMPVIIFSAYEGIFTGYLHFHGRFGIAASVPIWLNTVYLGYLFFFADKYGIRGLTIVSVLAVVAEAIAVFWGSARVGFRFKAVFDLADKYTRQTILLAIPAIITVSINNINTLINRALASGLPTGSMSRLDYANKLNVLIIGIFITAITSVIFPAMAKAFDEGNLKKGKKIMNGSIRSVLLITIPALVGLMVLAQPIVELAFMRGVFTQADADATAVCLRYYTLTLVSLSVNNVQNRVFYSLEDTKTPFYLGVVNVIVNVGFNLLLVNYMGINGLALSVSIATTAVCIASFYLLRKKLGNIGMRSYIKLFIKTGIASIIMGIFAYLVFFGLGGMVMGPNPGLTMKFLFFMIAVAGSVVVYGALLYLLGLKEAKDIKIILQRKLKKA
ncbi:murein biosynthesis integral membrane protein MurJ [Peptoniphilus sp. KCTC 25270]|uniref:murein biosynthesis integral membrane protein MurJ n=1 Tax=Peptoniphilus sp. KCTC 25270 TaxID=2897414 RepID=UPI001E5B3D78|nr:murein biosynthesis integral membrane protein MurJ [Peptoniphilus sp. KCTC 25270]MCD1147759.1 murein biosynthesis integral membrane protein MurJ [Peptoniphilus sp. KCTC 25270]